MKLRLARSFFRTLGASRGYMLVIGAAYTVYALSLLLQPARWSKTPAYYNLLAIMPAQAWGACFAVITCAMAGAVAFPRWRWLAVTALTAALAITLPWTGAFIVRWLTSDSTTPETWVSWAVNAYLIIRAAASLDAEKQGRKGRDGGDG